MTFLHVVLLLWAHFSVGETRNDKCTLPQAWQGSWLRGTSLTRVDITERGISTLGDCVFNLNGKYVFRVNGSEPTLYRCMIFFQDHQNLLRFKQTPPHKSEKSVCRLGFTNLPLWPLFRRDANPEPCPFKQPLNVTYQDPNGLCVTRPSKGQVCASPTRYKFSFAACPGTKTYYKEEIVECYGSFKRPGDSMSHFIGKVIHPSFPDKTNDFRCFIYNDRTIGMSVDAECRELNSLHDAAIKIHYTPLAPAFDTRLAKKYLQSNCPQGRHCPGFPSFLTAPHAGRPTRVWQGLDRPARMYQFFKERFVVRDQNGGVVGKGFYVSQVDLKGDHVLAFVVHVVDGCSSGYQCIKIHRHDRQYASQIIELQRGGIGNEESGACSPEGIPNSTLHETLLLQDSVEKPCPNAGRYVQMCSEAQATISIGCDDYQRFEVDYRCNGHHLDRYNCHGYWNLADGTGFLVGKEQSSGKKACFVYRKDDSMLRLSSLYETSCHRTYRPGVTGHRVIVAHSNETSELCSPVSSALNSASGHFSVDTIVAMLTLALYSMMTSLT